MATSIRGATGYDFTRDFAVGGEYHLHLLWANEYSRENLKEADRKALEASHGANAVLFRNGNRVLVALPRDGNDFKIVDASLSPSRQWRNIK